MIEGNSPNQEENVVEPQDQRKISRRSFLRRMVEIFVGLTAVLASNQFARNPYLRTPPTFPLPVDLDNPEFLLTYDYPSQTLALVESGISTAASEYFHLEPQVLIALLEQICDIVGIKTREVLPVFAFWAKNKATWVKQAQDSVVNSVQYSLNQTGLLTENTNEGVSRRNWLKRLIGNEFLAEKIDVVPTVGFYDKEPSLYAHAWIRGLQAGSIDKLVQAQLVSPTIRDRMNTLSYELVRLESRAQAVDASDPNNFALIKQYKDICNELSIYINFITRGQKNRQFDLCLFGLYIGYVQNIIIAEFKRHSASPSPAQLVYLTLVGSDSLYMESSTLEKRISGISSFTHPGTQLPHLIARAQKKWGLTNATPEKLDELFYGHGQLPSLYCQWSQV